MIMAQFSKIFPDIRYQLFKTYCMPLYGCQLWDFSQKDVEYFYTAWRKAIRFIWRIPFRSHNNLLSYICEDLPVEAQLHRRFMKFYYKVLSSVNSLVSTCGLLARDGSCSNVCNSLNVISRKYSINKYNLPPTYAQCLKQINSHGVLQDNEIEVTAKLIRELCQARDGGIRTILTREEIAYAIETLCTNWNVWSFSFERIYNIMDWYFNVYLTFVLFTRWG